MRLGQRVWLFDANSRIYGGVPRAPIFVGHFKSYEIIGETLTSWILTGGRLKINKKTGKLRPPSRDGYYGLSQDVYETPEAVNDACYVHEELPAILEMVRLCRDAKVLRFIRTVLERKGTLTKGDLDEEPKTTEG